MEKDIPFLQSILPRPFTATYMKGRNNYLLSERIGRAKSVRQSSKDLTKSTTSKRCVSGPKKVEPAIEPSSRTCLSRYLSGVISMPDPNPVLVEMSGLRSVFHHSHARSCEGIRHRSRQSSSVLRRSRFAQRKVRFRYYLTIRQ